MLKPASERISHQFFRQRLDERVRTRRERGAQFPDPVHGPAVRQAARRIDGGAGLVSPPRADGVEALQGEAERIDQLMAAHAAGRAMRRHPFADRAR